MKIRLNMKYGETDNATVKLGTYPNKQTAIYLEENGEMLCKATTAVDFHALEVTLFLANATLKRTIDISELIILKTYSENEGIEAALIAANVIGEKVTDITQIFVDREVCMPVYLLTDFAKKELNFDRDNVVTTSTIH